jgi:hypothetical protein
VARRKLKFPSPGSKWSTKSFDRGN